MSETHEPLTDPEKPSVDPEILDFLRSSVRTYLPGMDITINTADDIEPANRPSLAPPPDD